MTDVLDTPIRTSWAMPIDYEPGNYIASFAEDKIKFNCGQYKLLIGISRGAETIDYVDKDIVLTISDVVYEQEASVINNSSGLIVDQMKILVTQI